jgi:hypothetical protein
MNAKEKFLKWFEVLFGYSVGMHKEIQEKYRVIKKSLCTWW